MRAAKPAASAAEPTAPTPAQPLTPAAFAAAIEACGPFERSPAFAVAVSGGPDSLALAVLLRDWVAARGGSLLALHVDHRLRANSTAEAGVVAETLQRLGIASRVLTWARPRRARGGVQAAARAARYALLETACREAGRLHLCVAHHRDDQAETLLQRVDAGSGPDGLAAMPGVRALPAVRLLRPLLGASKAQLAATCAAYGLAPLDDPSNADPAFGRTELRARLERLAAGGLAPETLAEAARAAGRARAQRERSVGALLAQTVRLHPAGFARVDPDLAAAPEPVALRALARLAACVGGAGWPPRGRAVASALAGLSEGRSVTVGGCLLRPDGTGWLAVREPACAPPLILRPGESAAWDGRFAVALAPEASGPVRVGALGEAGWQAVVARDPALKGWGVPHPARVVLPAVHPLEGSGAPPQLLVPDAESAAARAEPNRPVVRFQPSRPLHAAVWRDPVRHPSFTVA